MITPRVVLSNGYGQFHLQGLAQSLHADGVLVGYMTGAALAGRGAAAVHRLAGQSPAVRRLLQRGVNIGSTPMMVAWRGEALHQSGRKLMGVGAGRVGGVLEAASLRSFAKQAASRGNFRDANIYHYRAGFGGRSLRVAKELGLILICDHSIAHPRVLRRLLPESRSMAELMQFWGLVEEDIAASDHLLVNSAFVSETCVDAGIDPDQISVAYTVPDAHFYEAKPNPHTPRGRPVALFLGTLEHRKGVADLVAAVRASSHLDLQWRIIGNWEPEARHFQELLPAGVEVLPRCSRSEAAQHMADATFFVFPTVAEGSARVVAEALLAGCYVITTKNAGSIVRDPMDGRLLPVGSPGHIIQALEEELTVPEPAREAQREATKAYAARALHPTAYRDAVYSAYARALDSSPGRD